MDADLSDPDVKNVDIGVCTYRRITVEDTLRSIARLVLKPNRKVRVIVADNDDTPSAKNLVEKIAKECSLNVTYIHAPSRNISVARNACLNKATAPYLAFIDDDEMTTRHWLEKLIETQEKTNADIVLGPVKAIYNQGFPSWMLEGDFHSTRPVWVKDQIITGYTCNVLIRRQALAVQEFSFRKELGRSGGEDTAYFADIYKAGGTFAYSPDAYITEVVTPERANLKWLFERRFRSGQTHATLLLEDPHEGNKFIVRNVTLAFSKVLFCLGAALIHCTKKSSSYYWILRSAVHMGAITRLLGKKELVQYG